MGLHQAGFEVVGVDIKPQPHYPFGFVLGDALEVLRKLQDGGHIEDWNNLIWHMEDFAAIWASPPCQAYSEAGKQWRKNGREYPDLIAPTRELLHLAGRHHVIENVVGAPLINPTMLNGAMFGMNLRRRRIFETSFDMPLTLMPSEQPSGFRMGRRPTADSPVVPVGHFSGVERARQVMGCHWMTQHELAQAIPPAYSRFIGEQLMRVLNG